MKKKFKRTPAEQKLAKQLEKQWGVGDFAIDALLEAERENESVLASIRREHPNWFNPDGSNKSEKEVREIIVLESDPQRLTPKDLALRKKLLAARKKQAR